MYGECVKQQKGGRFVIDFERLERIYELQTDVDHFRSDLLDGLYRDFESNFAGRVHISECVTAGVLIQGKFGMGLPGASLARRHIDSRAKPCPPVQEDLHRESKLPGNRFIRAARRIALVNEPFPEEHPTRPSFMSPPFGQPMPEKIKGALGNIEKILQFVREYDVYLDETELWKEVDEELGVEPGVAKATYTLAKRLDTGELDLCRAIWDTQAKKWVDDLIFDMDP
ncbi:MAG: hypothetical protein [Cressdnaviricota sp.]|nr:MAG: hypothetical protein [Cressdnaviricota sp.]